MPITPEEVKKNKHSVIPPVVFEVVDRLITENFIHQSAEVEQNDILAALEAKGLNREEVFDKGWLNFESCYEDAGWTVEYDKPAYNESYPATFTFSQKN